MSTQTEKFNANKLNYIIKNNLYDLPSDELNKLKKFLDASNEGTIKQEYKRINNGRLFALGTRGASLQNMKSEIRNSICNDYYKDLDIVNCMPSILKHLCDIHDVECDILTSYVNDRDSILKNHNIKKDNINMLICSNNITAQYKPYLNTFQEEIKQIKSSLIKELNEEFETFKEQTKKQDNLVSKFIINLIYNIEYKIINLVHKYLNKSNDSIFIFDGLLINKDIDINIEKLIRYIKQKLNINIKFKIKEMKGHEFTEKIPVYKYPKYEYYSDYRNFINKNVQLKQIKNWINKCISFYDNGGVEYFVVKQLIENKKSYFVTKYADCIKTLKFYCNIENPNYDPDKETDEKKKINLKYLYSTLNDCIKDLKMKGEIKIIFKIDYLPNLNKNKTLDSNIFNTFIEYPFDNEEYAHAPIENINFTNSKLYNHLQTQFFNNDKDEMNHFLDHIADIIQDPQNIKGTAHLFISKQGCGKGTLTKFMERLIGISNVVVLKDPDTYFKTNFNTSSTNKLLKVFEELGVGGGAYQNYNKLKGEITSDSERVEPKGINAYDIRHCARYWFYTNHELGSMYIEGDDRRYTIHNIKNKYANNYEYFKDILKEINNDDFIYSAFQFFANRQYEKKNVLTSYNTKHKLKQKIHNLPVAINFIIKYIETKYKKTTNQDNFVLMTDIKYDYKQHCYDNGTKYNFKTLITQFEKLKIKSERKQINGKRSMYINLNTFKIQNEICQFIKSDFKFDYYYED